jgi:hypothetical protein
MRHPPVHLPRHVECAVHSKFSGLGHILHCLILGDLASVSTAHSIKGTAVPDALPGCHNLLVYAMLFVSCLEHPKMDLSLVNYCLIMIKPLRQQGLHCFGLLGQVFLGQQSTSLL